MTNYPCPACGATADLDAGCPGCGRPPDPAAAEVIRLDGVLRDLAAAVETARLAYDQSTRELAATRARRNALAAEVRAWTGFQVTRSATPTATPLAPVSSVVPVSPVIPVSPVVPMPVAVAPEATIRTVQNVLFTLGGLLLGTAAVVFTAVAWNRYGFGGRAVILAIVTGLALGAPLLALRRRLVATAETFAALGLLLVVLDGYAAWYVNLFGLADAAAPSTYAAGVGVVTAAVAAGYGRATRLTGPRIVALLVAQPVLPLSMVDTSPEPAGWAVVYAAVAAADLAVLRWLRGPWRVLVLVLSGSSLAIAGLYALWAEVFAADKDDAARAGLAMLAVAATLLAGAAASADRTLREIAAGIAAIAVVVALGRYLAFAAPDHRLVLIAALTAAVALVARLAVPVGWRTGARVGAGVTVGVVGTVVVALALWAAGLTVSAAQPSWHADLARVSFLDWGLPAAVLLLAAGAVTALPRTAWPPVAAVAAGLAAVSLAPAFDLPWWAPSTVDLLVAAPLAIGLRRAARPAAPVREWVAVALAGHAVLAGLARPASTAWTLWSIVAICILVLAVGHRRSVGLAVAVFVLPPAVGATVVAADGTGSAALRWGLVAAALGVAVVAAVRWLAPDLRWAAVTGASAAALYASSTAALGDGEPYGVHGAAGLLMLAAIAGLATSEPDRRVLWVPGAAAIAPAIPAVLGAVPGLVAVLILPYSWLGSIWSGPPDSGPGLTPRGGWSVGNAAITLALLTVAAALAGTNVGRRGALAGVLLVGPAALLVGPTAAEARWPTVPFLALALGLACALGVTLFRLPAPAAVYAVALPGAGLAGLLPTKATTLAGLGLVVVVAAAIGAAGRVVGWLVSFSAGILLAIAATQAADLPLRTAAYAVLGVSAVALAVARTAARGRAAVEVAAHAGAVVAVILTGGSLGHTAAIFTLWGIALALCALGAGARQGYPAAAGGCELVAWWLLMSANEVAVLEAYTLPAAAIAAIVGVLALRRRPELRSWVAYGPALTAAFLPSLASALVVDGEPVRRLVLGAAAVAVVVAGAVWRRQAPVAVGGVVLVALALREMVVWWDLIPRWIPLAAAGFLLVGLAMTYERRRRDLARLRDGFRQLT